MTLELLILVGRGEDIPLREPKFFNAETPIRRPVKIPRSVLQRLEQHENVIGCSSIRDDRGRNRRVVLSKYFRAASVNLDNDGNVDLVVQPEPGAYLSANTAPFWVFRNTGKGYQLVFSIEVLGISLSKRKTNGLRGIETLFVTQVEQPNARHHPPRILFSPGIMSTRLENLRLEVIASATNFVSMQKPLR